MKPKHKRYLVTAALPYANGPLHIGHLAGAYLPADIYARHLRLCGEDLVFICGSDEHGAAITMKARKEGKSPREIIDTYHALFAETFRDLGISFDVYSRTSNPIHHQTSQDIFRTLYHNGAFEEQNTRQYFDAEAGVFLADRYITGTCPKCGYASAYGDQCESCGTSLSPTELIDPRSSLSGNKPELRETSHWFLSLDQHEAWLRAWIEHGVLDGEPHHDPTTWKAHVLGQCKSWLDGGLQPRAMTRDLDWGVDVPKDIPHAEGKKLYVWMDAPIGYISATIEWAGQTGKSWEPYWCDKDSALIHFIGKDNIVFHCLIFPVILKAHGSFVLPVNVPANQFMNLDEQKISTSRNWAIWVHEYLENAKQKVAQHVDVMRYALARNMPEQKDADFTWEQFRDLNDQDLVGKVANFINRVFVMTHKHYGGKVPETFDTATLLSSKNPELLVIPAEEIELAHNRLKKADKLIREFDFRGALRQMVLICEQGNALLQYNEPWKWVKLDSTKPASTLYTAWQLVNMLRLAMHPFMPHVADSLSNMMRVDKPGIGSLTGLHKSTIPDDLLLSAGHAVDKGEHLFTRIDPAFFEAQKAKLESAGKIQEDGNGFETVRDEIDYEAFLKPDLRVGTILQAARVKKADKLLELLVDLGFEKRTVVSGIAEHYQPEDIIGERVVVVANLKPRKMRGIESKGMILMATHADGKLTFVRPDRSAPDGAVIS